MTYNYILANASLVPRPSPARARGLGTRLAFAYSTVIGAISPVAYITAHRVEVCHINFGIWIAIGRLYYTYCIIRFQKIIFPIHTHKVVTMQCYSSL